MNWQPIETAPKGEHILVFCGGDPLSNVSYSVAVWREDMNAWLENWDWQPVDALMWAPIMPCTQVAHESP